MAFIKIEKFYTRKDTVKRMRKQLKMRKEFEKDICKHTKCIT